MSGRPEPGFWSAPQGLRHGQRGFPRQGGDPRPRGARRRAARAPLCGRRPPARRRTRGGVRGRGDRHPSPGPVSGIGFNRDPAPLAYDDLIMACNVLGAVAAGRRREARGGLLGLRLSEAHPVPFSEDDLWIGYPGGTNAYRLAKKMLLVLSDAYRRQYGFDSCTPVIANLYGPDRLRPRGLARHRRDDGQAVARPGAG